MSSQQRFNSTVRGRIQDIQLHPTDVSQMLVSLQLAKQPGQTGQSLYSIPISALQGAEFQGIITAQNILRLLQGDSSLINQQAKNLEVDVELGGGRPGSLENLRSANNQQSTTPAQGMRVATPTPSLPKIPGQGSTHEWADPIEEPLFTPIPVPFSRSDSLSGKVRIGFSILDVPIHSVGYQRDTRVESKPALRTAGTMKKHAGFAYESYTLQWIAQGPEEITKTVQEIYEQFSQFPVTTADGGPFGHPDESGLIPKSLALRSFTLSTVDGLPNALEVSLSVDPLIWPFYVQPSWGKHPVLTFDDAWCWPLFKIWCKKRSKSYFHGQRFNGRFELRFPDPSNSDLIEDLAQNHYIGESLVQDVSTMQSMLNGVLNGSPGFINSNNVKVIRSSQQQNTDSTLVALKLDDPTIWSAFYEDVTGRSGAGSSAASPYLVGFIDWERLAYHNLADTDGRFLPQSATVTDTFIQRSMDANTLKPVRLGDNDVAIADLTVGNVDEQIRSRIDQQIAALSSGSVNYADNLHRLQMEREDRVNNKYKYYGVLLQVNADNRQHIEGVLNKLIRTNEPKANVDYQNITRDIYQRMTENSSKYIDQEAPELILQSGVQNPDVIIERISATRNNNLAIKSFRGNPLPLHESVGGMDCVLVVEGKCFSEAGYKNLQAVKNEFDRRNLTKGSRQLVKDAGGKYKSREILSSFLYVNNELFHLLGVYFAMPVSIQIENIDEQPGAWSWSITFLEYDPTQFLQEEVRFMSTYMSQLGRVYHQGQLAGTRDLDADIENPIIQRAVEHANLQAALAQEEVYQDMRLPTFDELRSWIQSCKKISEFYDRAQNKKTFLNSGLVSSKGQQLSDYDLQILGYIRQFFSPQTSAAISEWRDMTGVSQPNPNAGRYAETDFFIYYDPNGSWGNIMDSVASEIMGKPVNLKAEGRLAAPEGTHMPQGGFVLKDPNLGSVSVSNENFFGAIDNEIGSQLSLMERQTYIPHATDDTLIGNIKQKIQDTVRKFDNRPKWWEGNTGYKISFQNPNINKDTPSVALDPRQSDSFKQGILDDSSRNFEEEPDPSGLAVNEQQQGTAVDSYLSLAWRQKKALEIAGQGSAQPRNAEPQPTVEGQFWFQGVLPALKNDSDLDIGAYTTEQLEKVMQLWADGKMPKPGDGPAPKPGTVEFLADRILSFNNGFTLDPYAPQTYLHNTLRVNSNFQSVRQNVVPALSTGKSLNDSLNGSWNYIDWTSSTWNNVDPNIIRSILLRHDGIGSQKALATTSDQGFGDFSPQFLAGAKTDSQIIQQLTTRYSKWMSEFNNVPSIALLALSMEMKTENRTLYLDAKGQIPEGTLNQMRKAASQVANKRFGLEAASAINGLLTTFPNAGQAVDEYFTGYVNLNRTYGSYLLGGRDQTVQHSDPFFFAFGGMILGDLGANHNAYLDGAFSPSGRNITSSLDRTNLLSVLAGIKRFDPNDKFDPDSSSFESQIRLSQRLRAALDPHSEAAIYGALVDLREHSAFGRLAGMFPAYQVLLINEGFYVGNTKLWDQHYHRAGVAQIEVWRSRKEPASECNIIFSNMFHNITAYAQMEALQHELAISQSTAVKEFTVGGQAFTGKSLRMFWDILVRKLPDSLRQAWQNNHLKQLALGVGTRLHVRMGYGSNAARLPVVFNGTVVNTPTDEGYVELRAVGDGYELNKPTTTSLVQSGDAFAFQDGGALGIGKDPSSIISEAMIGANLFENFTQGTFRDFTKGVVHFGEVYFEGVRHYPTETQINIYSSSQTQLEQQIPMIQNYFNVAALYNYNQSNLFSVSVKEPTLWKIMQVCRRACMDYVASPEHFTTRSTVFFGKWWWPYNYDYHPSIFELADNVQGSFLGITAKPYYSLQATNPHTLTHTPGNEDAVDEPTYKKAKEVAEKYYGEAKVGTIEKTKGELLLITYLDGARAYYVQGDPGYIDTTLGRTEADPARAAALKLKQYATGQSSSPGHEQYLKEEFPNVQPADELDRITGDSLQPQDFIKDVQVLVQHLRWKTYMQAYICHSMINLLDNKIEASADMVYTDAVGIHKYNGVLSPESLVHTIRYSVDSNIQPSQRRQMAVDTGLVLTTIQSGPGRVLGEAITQGLSYIPVFGSLVAGPAHDFIQQTPTTPAVNNGVVSVLLESVKEMYQGYLVMTGQPTLKPNDLLLLNDHHLHMRGPLMVREVTHRLDAENGFVTIVNPDCVVYPHGSQMGHHLVMALSTGILHKLGSYYFMRGITAATLGELNHWMKTRAKKAVAGPLAKYLKVREAQGLDEGTKSNILERYIQRADKELERKLAALTPERYAADSPKLIQARTALNDLRSIDDVEAYSRRFGVSDLELGDVGAAGPSRLQNEILLQELKWNEEYKEDVRVARDLLHEKNPEAVAQAHLDKKRAAWAAGRERELNQELYAGSLKLDATGSLEGTSAEFKTLYETRAQKLKQIDELEALAIRTEAQNTELGALKSEINTANKRLTQLADEFVTTHAELDGIIREAVNGARGTKFLDLKTPTFARILDGTFGGTAAGIKGTVQGTAAVIQGEAEAIKATKDARLTGSQASNISKLRTHLEGLKTLYTDVKEAKEIKDATKLTARLKTSYALAKDIVRGGSLLGYAGPQALLKVAYDVAVYTIGGGIIDGINARFKARQVAKIVPLMVGDPAYPYTAGIRGHQGAVIGDEPSWADNLIYGWSKQYTGDNQWVWAGMNTIQFTAAMLGIEVPEYVDDPVDVQYMEKLREPDAPGN